MTIEKLKRVMWRIRAKRPLKGQKISLKQLKLAIMKEIGTSEWAYKHNFKALKQLGWIKQKRSQGHAFYLTDKDLTDD